MEVDVTLMELLQSLHMPQSRAPLAGLPYSALVAMLRHDHDEAIVRYG